MLQVRSRHATGVTAGTAHPAGSRLQVLFAVKEAVGRVADPGSQCFRGSFTEQLTILTGKPAQVHEPPTARNHRYGDRVRTASGEFCVDPV